MDDYKLAAGGCLILIAVLLAIDGVRIRLRRRR
jgi:hypothetical protein